jgi:hypothetical protein
VVSHQLKRNPEFEATFDTSLVNKNVSTTTNGSFSFFMMLPHEDWIGTSSEKTATIDIGFQHQQQRQ